MVAAVPLWPTRKLVVPKATRLEAIPDSRQSLSVGTGTAIETSRRQRSTVVEAVAGTPRSARTRGFVTATRSGESARITVVVARDR